MTRALDNAAIIFAAVIAALVFGSLIAAVMLVNVRIVWAVVAFLAIAAVALIGFLLKEHRNDRRLREWADSECSAISAASTGREDVVGREANGSVPAEARAGLVSGSRSREAGGVVVDCALAIAFVTALAHVYGYVQSKDAEERDARANAVKLIRCDQPLQPNTGRVELLRADGVTRARCGRT